MTKRRIKNKWYMPKGWHTPRGIYRYYKELDKCFKYFGYWKKHHVKFSEIKFDKNEKSLIH